jgi:hypothetical protein
VVGYLVAQSFLQVNIEHVVAYVYFSITEPAVEGWMCVIEDSLREFEPVEMLCLGLPIKSRG